MDQVKGAQSLLFREAPYLISAASVAGSKEAEGPIGKLFDVTNEDDLFGAQTWEEAESNMQKEACVLAAGKAHMDLKEIRYLFGGDLLRQGIATAMGVEALQIPMFGLYGACSTSGEALALASMSAAAGYGGTMLAVTSSHFGSAEKEFRFPLGYANQRPLSSHWTVTGSGAFLVRSAEEYQKNQMQPYFSPHSYYRRYCRENRRLWIKRFTEYGGVYGAGSGRYHFNKSEGLRKKSDQL